MLLLQAVRRRLTPMGSALQLLMFSDGRLPMAVEALLLARWRWSR